MRVVEHGWGSILARMDTGSPGLRSGGLLLTFSDGISGSDPPSVLNGVPR